MTFLKNSCFSLVWILLSTSGLSAQSVKVITYNIRLDVSSDGENDWTHRRDYLLSQLKFYAPDVFGTQEGLPHQIEYLQKNLPGYGSEGVGREGKGKGESTHIFYDKSKFALKKSHTFWLSATPDTVSMGWDAACLRVCTGILLQNKQTKQQFWVFNTHLDHMGETARQNSADLILRKIAEFNSGKLPVVLMGDMNSEPGSVVVTRFKKQLRDTRELSEIPSFGPEGTFNGFHFEEPVKLLIDYIFVTSGVAVKKHAVLSDSRNLRYPSDHLPVYTELTFKKS